MGRGLRQAQDAVETEEARLLRTLAQADAAVASAREAYNTADRARNAAWSAQRTATQDLEHYRARVLRADTTFALAPGKVVLAELLTKVATDATLSSLLLSQCLLRSSSGKRVWETSLIEHFTYHTQRTLGELAKLWVAGLPTKVSVGFDGSPSRRNYTPTQVWVEVNSAGEPLPLRAEVGEALTWNALKRLALTRYGASPVSELFDGFAEFLVQRPGQPNALMRGTTTTFAEVAALDDAPDVAVFLDPKLTAYMNGLRYGRSVVLRRALDLSQ